MEPFIQAVVKKYRLTWHDADDLRQDLRVKALTAERKYKDKPRAERELIIKTCCRREIADFFKKMAPRRTEIPLEDIAREPSFTFSEPLSCALMNLTRAEQAVAVELLRGETIFKISKKLNLSQRTVYRLKERIASQAL